VFIVFFLGQPILLPYRISCHQARKAGVGACRVNIMPIILLFCLVAHSPSPLRLRRGDRRWSSGVLGFSWRKTATVRAGDLGLVLGPMLENHFITSLHQGG
jgi:hypothetical protein